MIVMRQRFPSLGLLIPDTPESARWPVAVDVCALCCSREVDRRCVIILDGVVNVVAGEPINHLRVVRPRNIGASAVPRWYLAIVIRIAVVLLRYIAARGRAFTQPWTVRVPAFGKADVVG